MSDHRVHCLLPYAQGQLFDLAADVERYPEFVPWWVAARVQRREGDVYYTDQVVRFATVRKRFASKTILRRPERIDVISTDGPVRDLHLTWLFDRRPDGCAVSLAVTMELRAQLFAEMFERAIAGGIGPIMAAFEARAHHIYGPEPGSRTASGGVTTGR